MSRWIMTLMGLLLSGSILAQPPLSKRDQQRKAEFEALIQAEEDYEATLNRAERAFENKDYVEARMAYEEAKQYNPEKEQWLTAKVNDLDILMARNVARRIDSVVVDAPRLNPPPIPTPPTPNIAAGKEIDYHPEVSPASTETDSLVNSEAQETAESTAQAESESDVSAPNQTVSARNIQLQPKPEAKPTVAPTPREEVKVKEDFTAFDDGVTEETFDLPNHSVLRVVVKEGIDVKVFKRVKHRWGGEFYFLDDQDVSRRYWEEQVKMYREKYPE